MKQFLLKVMVVLLAASPIFANTAVASYATDKKVAATYYDEEIYIRLAEIESRMAECNEILGQCYEKSLFYDALLDEIQYKDDLKLFWHNAEKLQFLYLQLHDDIISWIYEKMDICQYISAEIQKIIFDPDVYTDEFYTWSISNLVDIKEQSTDMIAMLDDFEAKYVDFICYGVNQPDPATQYALFHVPTGKYLTYSAGVIELSDTQSPFNMEFFMCDVNSSYVTLINADGEVMQSGGKTEWSFTPADTVNYMSDIVVPSGSIGDMWQITVYDSTPTGISSATTGVPDGRRDDAYYNLNGQRISKPSKGIYIHRGKKILLK